MKPDTGRAPAVRAGYVLATSVLITALHPDDSSRCIRRQTVEIYDVEVVVRQTSQNAHSASTNGLDRRRFSQQIAAMQNARLENA